MDEGSGQITKPEIGWVGEFVKKLPFHKLTHHDVTNLTFDLIAIGYTLFFTKHLQNESLEVGTWLSVISFSLLCVLWTSKL